MEQKHWLKNYFEDGFYDRYWGWQFDEKETQKTAQQVLDLLGASSGHILDWCGGWGRVSICFARKGFKITILDFMEEYLERAQRDFAKESLPLEVICGDCRQTPSHIQADYAVCLFNSVGFFNDREQAEAFKSLNRGLKPGAKILLDAMNLLFLAQFIGPNYDTRRKDGYMFRQRNDFNFFTNTLHSFFDIVDPLGELQESKEFYQRLYTPLDLIQIIETAGFKVENAYGDYHGASLSFKDPRIILVARKN